MSKKRDVRLRIRLNILSVELKDKGDLDQRPGRDGTQNKTIIDIPELAIPWDEFQTRLEHAQLVLESGYWVDPDDKPPIAITEEKTLLTATSARIHGTLISSSEVHDHVGFELGTTPAFGSSVVGSGSPVSKDTIPIESYYDWSGLTAETKYYYRFFAQNEAYTIYGLVRSFVTPAAE